MISRKYNSVDVNDPVKLFNIASKRVPAYVKFLNELLHKRPKISTLNEFKQLPLTDKQNYLKKHPLEELCLDGTILNKHFIWRSSGTTGEAFYWPKLPEEERYLPDWQLSGLREILDIDNIKTLIIVALGLGTWVSGETATWSYRILAINHGNITLLTPGYQFEEVVNIIEKFSKFYPQTLLISYPPAAKEIIEKAKNRNIPVEKYNIKLRLVGEGYSEYYRDYMNRQLGHEENDLSTIWSGYGSADFGAIGRETLITIGIRRLIFKNNLSNEIFGEVRLPSLCQFDESKYFLEVVDRELIISRYQGVPLIRYKTGDRGKIIKYENMLSLLKNNGLDVLKFLKDRGVDIAKVKKLPFVLIYGRIDGSTTFYGVNILVSQIKEAIESNKILRNNFTGKFQLNSVFTENLNPVLELYLEKRENISDIKPDEVSVIVADELKNQSSEYAEITKQQKEKALPKIYYKSSVFFDKSLKVQYIKNHKEQEEKK